MTDTKIAGYNIGFARSQGDLAAAQDLRARCFRPRGRGRFRDRDSHDALCDHVIIRRCSDNRPVGCFRIMILADGSEIGKSYSSDFYDLSALSGYPAPMAEIGRFCIDSAADSRLAGCEAHSGWSPENAEILRAAWAWIAGLVQQHRLEMLFGCSSFRGTAATAYTDSFALLRERHLGPRALLPGVKADHCFPYASMLQRRRPDLRLALKYMPPLLRAYLAMGGWVSDHAVVDVDLDTIHVFTALEIKAIPPARARRLRSISAMPG